MKKLSILVLSMAILIAVVVADDGSVPILGGLKSSVITGAIHNQQTTNVPLQNPTAQLAQAYIGGGGNGAYLFFDGITENVPSPGAATISGHEGWIEVSSFNYSIKGQQSPGQTNSPELGDLIVVKYMDGFSPKIYQQACNGESKDAKLDIVRDGATIMEYHLTNAVVSNVQVLGAGVGNGQKPLEVISLRYTKIEWKYSDSSTGPVDAEWDSGIKITQ